MVTPLQIPEWLAKIYPFSAKRTTTPSGAQMSYVDEGEGEAVLMLHGNPTWSFFYRNLIAELSPQFRCIAPDHVGMGLSEKPQDYDYRLETRIHDIEALVDSLGLKKVHLVVHDWGGAIGFGLAVRRPELVARIVILNTAAFPAPHIPGRIALCRTPLLGEFLVRGLNAFAAPATWMSMHSRALSADEKRAYLFPYDSWANRVAVYQFVKDIPMEATHPSRALLEEIGRALPGLDSAEKLILWGGRDFCFDDRFLSTWSALYPNAKVERFGSVGHYILDDGGPEILDRIKSFLAQKKTT